MNHKQPINSKSMTHSDFLKKAEYIKILAQKETTGSPKELAHRLGISERSLYRTISALKKTGYPIKYSRSKQSYCK